jgi:hypothetical protein
MFRLVKFCPVKFCLVKFSPEKNFLVKFCWVKFCLVPYLIDSSLMHYLTTVSTIIQPAISTTLSLCHSLSYIAYSKNIRHKGLIFCRNYLGGSSLKFVHTVQEFWIISKQEVKNSKIAWFLKIFSRTVNARSYQKTIS